MIKRALLAVCGGLLVALSACTPAAPAPAPEPLDFTRPGVAQAMVHQLLDRAGSQQALMVRITANTIHVSVLENQQPVTWAYRDGAAAKVASDLQYVDQATFLIDRFNIADVGALFRAAAGQSGSATGQSLTIVDTARGDVEMSVSTEPESRTVFFNNDATLTEVLDFETLYGITQGLRDTTGTRTLVYSITVISDQSASTEYPGTGTATLRRTRGTKVPAITTVRSNSGLPLFNPAGVNPAAIWRVVCAVRGRNDVPADAKWSVTIDNREKLVQPRMYFAFGFSVVVAEIDGTIVT